MPAHMYTTIQHYVYRGQILGCNWDKSFPPCYSQSPLQMDFTIPFETGLLCKHCIQKPQVWELSRFCPETSTKLYVHELGFRNCFEFSKPCLFWSCWLSCACKMSSSETRGFFSEAIFKKIEYHTTSREYGNLRTKTFCHRCQFIALPLITWVREKCQRLKRPPKDQ
jgi:hypothetical protein